MSIPVNPKVLRRLKTLAKTLQLPAETPEQLGKVFLTVLPLSLGVDQTDCMDSLVDTAIDGYYAVVNNPKGVK
jgi:hypothetical protein